MGITAENTMNMAEEITRPTSFLALVNLVLAGDVVLSGDVGQVNIASWSSLMQWASPVHVLAIIILIGASYYLIEPLLKYGIYKIIANVPGVSWLFRLNEKFENDMRKAKSPHFILKADLKAFAMEKNHAVAMKLRQEVNRDDNRMWDAGRHLTVFFFLVLLDDLSGGPFISLVDNLSWHGAVFWGAYAIMLAFYVYASIHDVSDYVYIGELRHDTNQRPKS